MSSEKPYAFLNSIPKDVAKLIATYTGGFFSLSSINKKFRSYFQEDLQKALKKSKIMVKKNIRCSFLLTFDGKLFASGYQGKGQFGIPNQENLKIWTRIGPSDQKITRVVLSATWNVYVQAKDAWYGAGSNSAFQLAPNREEKEIVEWILIESPRGIKNNKIIDLVANNEALFIRCENNQWYARGLNDYGQLSAKSNRKYVLEWEKLGPPNKKILSILPCSSRTFVYCEDGWYGCGKNENGELGLGYFSQQEDWKRIYIPGKKIRQLKANDSNTVIYCDDEEWYGCGENKDGRLGTGNTDIPKAWVRLGPADEQIQQVWLEPNRLFLRGKTETYSCGWDESYIFGGPHIKETFSWQSLQSPGKPIDEIIDRDSALFGRCGDEWYAAGDDDDGYFGLGYPAGRWWWSRLSCKGKNISSLLPAFAHTFVCCEDGWYFAGDVSEGQSGRKDKMELRACWTKILSHDQTVEEAIQKELSKNSEINPEQEKISFRQAVKKLYNKEMIQLIEDLGNNISGQSSDIFILYNKTNPNIKTFNFFIPIDYWDCGFEEDHLYHRLQEVLEYECTGAISLWWNRHLKPGPYSLEARYSERVRVAVDNYDELVRFLERFEWFLEQPENRISQDSGPGEGGETERKQLKKGC